MIKLSESDLLKAGPLIRVRMHCMICMIFPEVIIKKDNTRIWKQLPNPVPSNRLCSHLKHKLECPYCEFGIEPEEEIRERYFIEPEFREEILKRDNYTCQACGYNQKEKPPSIPPKKKGESDADYLYRRFVSTLASHDRPKLLVVAHYSRRYEDESYDERHKMKNARTLCEDCHNMETAKHQMEAWLKRMEECPWLKSLE